VGENTQKPRIVKMHGSFFNLIISGDMRGGNARFSCRRFIADKKIASLQILRPEHLCSSKI